MRSMKFQLVWLWVAVDNAVIFFSMAQGALLTAVSTKFFCQHLRSIHTWELGTFVLVVCEDAGQFEFLLLFPAMVSSWSVRVFVDLNQSFQSHVFPAAGGLKLRAALVVVTLHSLAGF